MKNLATRTVTGIVFLIIMVCGIWFSEFSFAALFILILTGSMLEFQRMTIEKGRHLWARILAILSGITLFVTVFVWKRFDVPARFTLISFVPILLAMVGSIFEKIKDDYETVSHAYTSFIYIALPLTIAVLSVFHDGVYDGTLLLCFFGIIWGSDVGAYCLGCTLGRNGKKLCPKISPKKSWWGIVGGMIAAIAIAVGLHFLLPESVIGRISLLHCIVLSVLMNVVGIFGDLVESVWKRHYGMKDSGHSIPGHGGFLDRFDSSLFALPVGTIYLLCFGFI